MKNTFLVLGMAGVAVLGFSSFSFAQDQQEEQSKKTRHIKLTKIEDGKKMELDTILSADAVFVWNGDTINPAKRIKKFSPSEFDKMHHPDGLRDRHRNVKIYQYGVDNNGKAVNGQLNSDDDMEVYTADAGDSAQRKIIIHKRLKDGNEKDRIIYLNHLDGQHFPPMPPMRPMPHMRMFNGNHSEGIINLKDPNIISYKKKKMSGDREKIEIIRKKSQASDDMNFDFQMDDAMNVPEPPRPPVFDHELNIDEPAIEDIEMEINVNEKNDSKTGNEVTQEENK